MADGEGSYYIELCKNPIRFDPVDKVTNVFYDDANKQVKPTIFNQNTVDMRAIKRWIFLNTIGYNGYYKWITSCSCSMYNTGNIGYKNKFGVGVNDRVTSS